MPVAIKTFIGQIKRYVKDVNPEISLLINYYDDRIDFAVGGESGCFLSREQLDYSHKQDTELSREEVLAALAVFRALSLTKQMQRIAA